MIHFASPAGQLGSHTSQPDLTTVYKISDKTRYFSYNYFVTLSSYKAVFSIPGYFNTTVNSLKSQKMFRLLLKPYSQ
jgi:hypothetical protein